MARFFSRFFSQLHDAGIEASCTGVRYSLDAFAELGVRGVARQWDEGEIRNLADSTTQFASDHNQRLKEALTRVDYFAAEDIKKDIPTGKFFGLFVCLFVLKTRHWFPWFPRGDAPAARVPVPVTPDQGAGARGAVGGVQDSHGQQQGRLAAPPTGVVRLGVGG